MTKYIIETENTSTFCTTCSFMLEHNTGGTTEKAKQMKNWTLFQKRTAQITLKHLTPMRNSFYLLR